MSTKVNGKNGNAATYELTPQQAQAIAGILAGRSGREVATAVGVVPETVSRWRHSSPAFAAALNLQRQTLAAEQFDALRALRTKALAVLTDVLNDEHADYDIRAKLALSVLRLDVGELSGPVTAEQQELEWQESRQVDLLAVIRAADYGKPGTVVYPSAETEGSQAAGVGAH